MQLQVDKIRVQEIKADSQTVADLQEDRTVVAHREDKKRVKEMEGGRKVKNDKMEMEELLEDKQKVMEL